MIDLFGGPDRDRTDDLFHAMEARSQTAPQAHIRRDATFLLSPLGRNSSNLAAALRGNQPETGKNKKLA
jgi:hypothetical protein